MNEKHIGSELDDFLEDEGILQEVEQLAVKRILAMQLLELMASQNLTKTEMARRMDTSRASLDRLLDVENESVTLQTMEKAARALGKRLRLSFC